MPNYPPVPNTLSSVRRGRFCAGNSVVPGPQVDIRRASKRGPNGLVFIERRHVTPSGLSPLRNDSMIKVPVELLPEAIGVPT